MTAPDLATPQFKKAFDVIRRLNVEIKAQNLMLPSIQTSPPTTSRSGAVTKWLELHDTEAADAARHAAPSAGFRSATMGSGERAGPHPSLLPRPLLLPVHSSIKYHVFERQEVLKQRRHRGTPHRAPGCNPLDAARSHVPRPGGMKLCDSRPATSSSSSISWSNCNNCDRTYPTIAPARPDHVSPWRTTWHSASIHRSA